MQPVEGVGTRAAVIERAANRIARACQSREPTAPVRDLLGHVDVDLAYAVQAELTRRREQAGGIVVGRKIGLASPAVQRQFGVDQPIFGALFAHSDVSGAAVIPIDRLLQPKVGAEVAFVLRKDLEAGALSPKQIRDAVDFAVAALEIADSRISCWDIAITDMVADNASCGLFILSDRQLTLEEFEPREVEMRMHVNGQLVSTGSGAECLGDPLHALSWLAQAARKHGEPLRAGQIILSGALGPIVSTSIGSEVNAYLGPLGSVSASFV